MKWLYLLGIYFYRFAVRMAALFNPKAKEWINGRKGLLNSLPYLDNKEVIWFHCASLGEFDQGLPLMQLIREQKPNCFILITFFSPSGFNHFHKRNHPVDFACYLPLDTPRNAEKFVTHFRPSQTYFVKYEFWSNYIFALKISGSKIYSISTLLRPEHRFFKWYGEFFRKTLRQFDYFFVQNEATKKLLASIHITNVLVTGDTRFDRVIENKKHLKPNPIVEQFVAAIPTVFICGSTWEVDEALLIPLINENLFEKVIIAPHNVDEKHIQSIVEKLTVDCICYSQSREDSKATVLIIDTIGQLASAYSYGTIAYVGGGFTGSLHNILEPAVFGLPVIFGPKHKRFPEAQAFVDSGFGFSISNESELKERIQFIESKREDISKKEIQFVEHQAGASKKILDFLS